MGERTGREKESISDIVEGIFLFQTYNNFYVGLVVPESLIVKSSFYGS